VSIASLPPLVPKRTTTRPAKLLTSAKSDRHQRTPSLPLPSFPAPSSAKHVQPQAIVPKPPSGQVTPSPNPQTYAEFLRNAIQEGKFALHRHPSSPAAFGRAHATLGFVRTPDLYNILIILWKSGALDEPTTSITRSLSPSTAQLWSDLQTSYTIDFSILRDPSIPRSTLSTEYTCTGHVKDGHCCPALTVTHQARSTSFLFHHEARVSA